MILNMKTLQTDKIVQSLWGNSELLILLESAALQKQIREFLQKLVHNLHNGIAQKVFWIMKKTCK